MSTPAASSTPTGVPSREELLAIRAELGELKTEAKRFTPQEPINVTRLHCSAAAGGSGDFHSLRKSRNAEEQRLAAMDAEWDAKVRELEYTKRREERLRAEEQEREVKRSKRASRKERQQQAKQQAKGAALLPSIANDGSFMEVMEAKERLKKLLALRAGAATAAPTPAESTTASEDAPVVAAASTDTAKVEEETNPAPSAAEGETAASRNTTEAADVAQDHSSSTPVQEGTEEK